MSLCWLYYGSYDISWLKDDKLEIGSSSSANSLDGEEDISITFDTPSMNGSGRRPVLDLQVWISRNLIYFSVNEKPMTSKQDS